MTYEGTAVWYDAKGYACVWRDGKTKKVHVLVWEAVNGPKPEGHEIHHRDHDRSNFALENLELLSRSDHRRVHAGWVRGGDGKWIAKPCTECGELLPLNAFYVRKGYTPTAKCKPCHCRACEEWKKNNIERSREIKRNSWRRRNARGEGSHARS